VITGFAASAPEPFHRASRFMTASDKNSTVIVVQCQKPIKSVSDATKYCNLKEVKQIKTATGAGSTSYVVNTGKIGTAGMCVSKKSCVIAVATQKPAAGVFPKITFK
jgi:hypothetical protein